MAFTLDELKWERERRRCAGDGTVEGDLAAFEYFCATYIKIKHPRGRRLFKLRDAQRETVRSFLEDEKVLILKARQIGFTTVVMTFCLWAALFRPDYRIIILNRREKDAVKNLGMLVFAWDSIPRQLKRLLPERTNKHTQEFKLSNGSEVLCYPSNNNPARGDTASLIVLDEWAFMPNPEEAWASVEPTIDIGGRLIALSTANGHGNMFHDFWVKSELGELSFSIIFFPWSAVPERDQRWYDQKKRERPEWQLHQEYPSDPESAFIKSGNSVFGGETLEPYVNGKKLPQARGQLIESPEYGSTSLFHSIFVPAPDGPLSVYEPPQADRAYVIGADISLGLEHSDKSAAHVIRADTGRVVAVWHGLIDPDLFAEVLMRLGYWYNTAVVGPEANNMGIATVKTMKRHGYPALYRRRTQADRRDEKNLEQLGWLTHKGTKGVMISDLAQMLRDQSLVLEDGPTIVELQQYRRAEDGKMHGSPFDDRVMSLAIAVQMLAFATQTFYAPSSKPDWRTFEGQLARLQELNTARESWVIGAGATSSYR
jgi:hypothetical protein